MKFILIYLFIFISIFTEEIGNKDKTDQNSESLKIPTNEKNSSKEINNSSNLLQVQQRTAKKFFISLYYSYQPTISNLIPISLGINLNNKFTVAANFNNAKQKNEVFEPSIGNRSLSLRRESLNLFYFDSSLRFFPAEKFPVYLSALIGRETSNQTNEYLVLPTGEQRFIYYELLKYKPTDFFGLGFGFHWFFQNGITMNMNYNSFFIKNLDAHSSVFFTPTANNLVSSFLLQQFLISEMKENLRDELWQKPLTFSIGYAF